MPCDAALQMGPSNWNTPRMSGSICFPGNGNPRFLRCTPRVSGPRLLARVEDPAISGTRVRNQVCSEDRRSWCKTAPAGFCQYLAGGARLHLIASALSQPLKNLPDMATNVSMASATHRGGRPIFRITPPVCFLAEPPLEKGARIDAGRTVALNQDQIAAMVLRSCQAVRARRAHP